MSFTIVLPIRAVNTSNSREHWATIAKRAAAHRQGATLAVAPRWRTYGFSVAGQQQLLDAGLVVTLTRIAPQALDDDGAVTSMKACRDGVADALGLKSDRDPRVTWAYAQERGKPKEYAVEILVEERTK